MMSMDGWDIALYVLAAYLAVRILVRMMAARRDRLIEQFRQEMEHRRQEEEKKKQNRRSRRQTDEEEAKAA